MYENISTFVCSLLQEEQPAVEQVDRLVSVLDAVLNAPEGEFF